MSEFYKPEEIELLASVMDRACADKAMTDADKELLAMRILHVAETGERDPDRLLKVVMAA